MGSSGVLDLNEREADGQTGLFEEAGVLVVWHTVGIELGW